MNRLGFKQLTLIMLGGVISLPLLLVGFTVGHLVPTVCGIVLCFAGNFLLATFGLLSAQRIVTLRCSTSQTIEHILGPAGKGVMAFFMAASMLAWFAIQTHVVVSGLVEAHRELGCLVFGGITALCFSDLHSLERYSKVVAPLMLAIIATALLQLEMIPFVGGESFSCREALVIVIGGAVLAVIDLPSFFKEAVDASTVKRAVIAIFMGAVPLVESCGVLLAQQGDNLVAILSAHSLCMLLPLAIILSASLTNMANLYSAAQSIEAIGPVKGKKAFKLATLLGISLSPLPVAEHISTVLAFLAVGAVSFGGLLLADVCKEGKARSQAVSWALLFLGMGIGISEVLLGSAENALVEAFSFVFLGAVIQKRRKSHGVA